MRALAIALALLALPAGARAWGRTFRLTAVMRSSAPQQPVALFEFRKPGCYASGSVMGTRGETMNVNRNSVKYCAIDAGEQVCGVNEACVTERGLLAEKARKNYYPTPLAPAAGSTTAYSGNVLHTFWVVGTGSQTISISGGGTGLPCTATQAAPCRVTLPASRTVSFSAVTGSLSRAQLETGNQRTSLVPVYNTDQPKDEFSFPVNPLTDADPNFWCIETVVSPLAPDGVWRTNTGPSGAAVLLSGTGYAANNTLCWQFSTSGGGYSTSVVGSTGVGSWLLNKTTPAAFTGNILHRIGCANLGLGARAFADGKPTVDLPDRSDVIMSGFVSPMTIPAPHGHLKDLATWKGPCR